SLVSLPGRAHDPALPWRTITTPHFEVHFHAGTYELAVRVAQAAEAALKKISAALEHRQANRIQLIISDQTDSANGFATVLPYNTVHLLASAPENLSILNDFDDHIWILVSHELTHIVHMDTISGLPAAFNMIFGRTVFPNGAQPTWFTEGLAVHFESSLSSAGRIRSSLFKMFLRTAVLAGVFPEIDQVSGTMQAWPQGTAPYLYGAFFIDYLVRRFGETALTDLSQRMGGMLVPWTLNIVARNELGSDYVSLYEDWRQTELLSAQATLKKLQQEGLTPFRFLTRRAQFQQNPRLSPGSGQILYYSAPTNRWPTMRLVAKDGSNDRILTEVNNNAGATFTPDGRAIIYSQTDIVDQFYVFNDLFHLDLETGRTTRLTRGARARSPDISPDGRSIVFVQNRTSHSQLMLAGLDDNDFKNQTIVQLTNFTNGAQLYTPRFSPDGRHVVFSATTLAGGRNIWLLQLDDHSLKKLTDQRFMDLDPVFSPSGGKIFFSSDRTGIYNIYSLNISTLEISRLTNLVTGAFTPDPAPDESGLAFTVFGKDGFDIAWLDLPLAALPTENSREPRPDPPYVESQEEYPVETYQPWSTLWPRAWFPIYGADPWGSTYGLMVAGRDALGKLDYKVELTFGPEEKQVYLDLSILTRLFYPSLYMYVGRHVYRYYNEALINDRPFAVDKERLTLYFDVAFPFSSFRESHYIFFNYDIRMYDRWTEVPRDPMGFEPKLPDDSNLAWLGIGWSYSNVRRFTQSISSEEGISTSLSLRYSHPTLGSGSRLAEARFRFRAYVPIIRDWHHVLAFGIQGGISLGDKRKKGLYVVGGLPVRDPFLDAYYGYRYGGLHLRGYPLSAFVGSMFMLSSIEYRFCIFDIESGVLTLPFYLRRLHAAVFVDVGGTSAAEPSLDLLKVGIGAELRLDMYLGYYLPTTLRFGYARGLSERGNNNFYLTMGYGF
ncbi:MAG: PD40 domain-containing protein, partial [Deltaproteobacteria bacterium]|nr:PD40 domain-containing protein [Deltaproteobacteria bacterium]